MQIAHPSVGVEHLDEGGEKIVPGAVRRGQRQGIDVGRRVVHPQPVRTEGDDGHPSPALALVGVVVGIVVKFVVVVVRLLG